MSKRFLRFVTSPVGIVLAMVGLAFGSLLFGGSPVVPAAYRSTVAAATVVQGEQVLSKVQDVALERPTEPTTYTVREGDTLNRIAGAMYGNANTWPALWWTNRHIVTNPNDLKVGQVLTLSSWHPITSWLLADAQKAEGYGSRPAQAVTTSYVHVSYASSYSFSGLEALWVGAGGPAGDAWSAATIAECESGGNITAYNHYSGASGLWQILGAPMNWTGSYDWFNPFVNAEAAVAKFRGAGDTFAPWVCQA